MEKSSQNENRISNAKCERIKGVVMEEKRTTNPLKNHGSYR
jgi:hypothetical protein